MAALPTSNRHCEIWPTACARSRSGGGGGDDDTTVEEDKKGAEYGREANFSVAAADHDTSALRRSRGGGDEGESPQRRLRTALK